MKRLGLIILFICVIILSFFLRKRNEGFLDTTGATELAYDVTKIYDTTDGIFSMCFNKINNMFYFINTKQGTVNSLSSTGQVNTIMDTNTSIVNNGSIKLSANNITPNTKYIISCDNNGNLYIGDQKNFRIYKIPYSSIQTTSCTPELFTVSDETPTKIRVPVTILFDSDNNMYVLWSRFLLGGTYRVSKYDSNNIKTDIISDNGSQSVIGMAMDSERNIYWGMNSKLLKNGIDTGYSFPFASFIGCDSSNNLYYQSSGSLNLIKNININSNYTITVSATQPFISNDRRFSICFDNSDNIYAPSLLLGDNSGIGIYKFVPHFRCKNDSSYSSTGRAPCTPCPSPLLPGRLTCVSTGVTCKPNYVLDTTLEIPLCKLKPCPAGTYSTSGLMPDNGSCTACPTGPGAICGTVGPPVCDSNNYIRKGSTSGSTLVCESKPCVAGTNYSSTGNAPCKACPPSNIATCTKTSATCLTNFTLSPSGESCVPTPCPAGTYNLSTGTQPGCITCPTGATCTTNTVTCGSNFIQTGSGSSTICSPIPCATGFYSLNGFAPCKSCPTENISGTCLSNAVPTCSSNYTLSSSGESCDPRPCITGFYSSTGYAPCITCPTNSICTSNNVTCQTGYTLNNNQCLTNPIPCPIGSYSASGQTAAGSTTCTPCPTGYTTTAAASTAITNCVKPLTPQDILTWLTTNGYNVASPTTTLPANAKYYGLSLADFTNFPTTNVPTISSGNYSGTLQTVESYLKPLIVTSSVTNLLNKNSVSVTRFNYLTNSQGEAVGGQGVAIQYPTTSIQYSQGSEQKKKQNITSCVSMTDPTSCTYKWNGTEGPITANPCPALNSWFDFDKEACVDALGNKVTTKNTCSDSGVYNLTTNACVPVRVPVKSMPLKTLGQPGPGDYKDCKTVDQGDCTLLYTLGSNVTTTNPCSGLRPNYDFKTRSCTGDACCSLTVQQAANNRECSKYVNAVNTPNAKCANPRTPLDKVCCKPENASKIQCQSYYSKTSIFNASYNNLCQPSGFQDYAQQFVLTGPSIPRYF